VWPKTSEEFSTLIPEGWYKIPFPKELLNDPEKGFMPDPYRVCSIKCLHAMEQKLEQLKYRTA